MSTSVPKKNLAELKAAMDHLKEKYQDEEPDDSNSERNQRENKLKLPNERNISHLREAISEYLNKVNSKKLQKKNSI